jgi:hypothetical protein
MRNLCCLLAVFISFPLARAAAAVAAELGSSFVIFYDQAMLPEVRILSAKILHNFVVALKKTWLKLCGSS